MSPSLGSLCKSSYSGAKAFLVVSLAAVIPRAAAFCSAVPFITCTVNNNNNKASSLFHTHQQHSSSSSSSNNSMADNNDNDDPYLWLEQVESPEALDFARAANEACLQALGHPEHNKTTQSYQRILQVLESDDRIPHVTQFGVAVDNNNNTDNNNNNTDNNTILMNFWKDASNPKGLWRTTTLQEYRSDDDDSTNWTVVLNVDALAATDGVSWVWKGSRPLPRGRDTTTTTSSSSSSTSGTTAPQVTRALVSLSRGGSDATTVREFDLLRRDFVKDDDVDAAFDVPAEAKTRASYKSRDVLLVGTDFGEKNSLTDSGYPRTVREWVRGTKLEDAPTVLEGEATDVSVSAYISDERVWGGGIYEVHSRALTFYTSKYWVRKVQFEHLLSPDDPARAHVPEPPEFTAVDIQDDADLGFLGKLAIITLRSDWEPVPGEQVYKKGSVLYVDADTFLAKGSAACEYQVLFAPTDRTAYEYYTATKNYLILSTMDTVKSKLEFYKIGDGGSTLIKVQTGKSVARIRDASVRPVDPYAGSDMFWFTTSDYVTPSTLFLADASKAETASDGNDDDVFITEKLKSLPPQYDSSNLIVEQRMATSKDGTEIPYFIIMDKDLVLDGTNPTLLYGYGGFEVSLGPHYVATAGLAWLERGGVYVEANIRGGGEFGPGWHQAALKANRNKCYEDFIAVAEDLISSNICKPKTLAIRGGSNGGLLMGNMYTMRPDLFGAIHCAVPLLDMKRYHTLLAGASWMAEYGNPDTSDWEFLQKYSPYHNIDEDADYPPILVTTSTRDDRVHPAHARKFVKKLWDTGKGKWRVYYYENIEGGHGGAADAKQSAFMTALAYDFMFETLSKNINSKDK